MPFGLKKQLLFVYGTLRRQGSNSWRLEEASFAGRATIEGLLWKVDWYPAFLPGGGCKVVGELREVNDSLLRELDAYEGNEYRRERCRVKRDDGEMVEAWVYVWIGDVEGYEEILSGDWLKR